MSDVNPIIDHARALTRRAFFGQSALGVGAAALGSLFTSESSPQDPGGNGLPGLPHHAPKAKRVIYLLQNGAPSHRRCWPGGKADQGQRAGHRMPAPRSQWGRPS